MAKKEYSREELLAQMTSQSATEITELKGVDPRLNGLSDDSMRDRLQVNYEFLQKLKGGTHTKCRVSVDGIEYVMRILGLDEKIEIEQEVARWWATIKDKPSNPIVCEGMQLHMKMLKTLRRSFSSCPENLEDADLMMHQEMGTALSESGLRKHGEFYIVRLYKSYIELEKQYDPMPDLLTKEQIKQAVEDLIKKKTFDATLSWHHFVQIFTHMSEIIITNSLTDKFCS